QVQERGSGRNLWISPPRCLQFSIKTSLKDNPGFVVFIQYLLSLAVIKTVRTKQGYEDILLKLKWPNDIYAEIFSEESTKSELVKIGSVLVNSNFVNVIVA
ncbi:25205_t:CDS:2, partial [Dentiscutata erythropus]